MLHSQVRRREPGGKRVLVEERKYDAEDMGALFLQRLPWPASSRGLGQAHGLPSQVPD